MRNKREIEGISLSFLDVISCGFGAIILLLVMPIFNTVVIEDTVSNLEGYLAALQEELFDLRGEAKDINRKMIRKEDPQSEEIARLLRLNAELSALKSKHKKMLDKTKVSTLIEGKLVEAKQSLTDEMKKLLVDYRPVADENKIGGIPVDSEYIIFIIDTSPSMHRTWPLVLQMVTETLKVYPKLKGFQVLDDMGEPLTRGYSGGNFIPYSELDDMIRLMDSWPTMTKSNSNPTEGIIRAINDYHHPHRDKKISLYVYGDDFAPRVMTNALGQPRFIRKRDINDVLKKIQTANTGRLGKRKVRIHAVAFPIYLIDINRQSGRNSRFDEFTIDFTILMRTLAERNEGTFVGLNRLTP
jgi:hypothetical protein